MTPKQTELAQAMRAAVQTGPWDALDGSTIRYSETGIPTPQYAKDARWWDAEAYDRHVFIKVVTGAKWLVLVRVSAAPWSGADDHPVTLRRALEVVANPAESFTR